MFSNSGKKIKSLSTILFIIGCVVFGLAGFGGMIAGISMLGHSWTAGAGIAILFGSLVFAAIGIFSIYISCIVLFGYGQIIHSVQNIEKKLLGDEYQPFEDAPAAPTAPVTPAAPVAPATVKPASKACPKCGLANDTDAKFCVKCGYSFINPAPNSEN